ncbi:MAG: hypothetical protein JJU03_10505 [Idiomarina sp.]|nr:hypothetical protein [Idiomarina sp.]
MNKYIIPFTATVSLLGFMLPAQYAYALESTNSVQGEVNSQVWLDNRYCPTPQGEATYYLNDFNAVDGGFAVTLNYADTHTLRLETNVRRLTFCAPEYFGPYRSYFKTGELLEEGEFDEDGLRQGWVRVYDREGKLVRDIPYVDNQVHGTYTTYADGIVRRVEEVVAGERHGINRLYQANGELVRELNFVEGQRHGELKEWDSEGNLSRTATYHEGNLHGVDKRFFADGEIGFIGKYDHGTPVGSQRSYHKPGQLSNEQVFNDSGTRISEHRYNDAGEITYAREPVDTPHGSGVETRHYQPAGILDGVTTASDDGNWQLRKSYTAEGDVIERSERYQGRNTGSFVRRGWGRDLQYGTFKDGNLHGEYYTTNDDGEVMSKGEYDRGTKVGRWVERTDYQKVVEHYNDRGELDGMREEFNAEGDLVVREQYADGVLHGDYLRYSDEQLVAKGEFVAGKREGDWVISLFYAGGLIQHGHYVNDKQVGRWTLYDEYGHRRAINQYNDEGQLHGRQLEFAGNGSLRMLKEYRAGREHGIRVYYHHGSAHGRSRYEDGYYVEDIDDNIDW